MKKRIFSSLVIISLISVILSCIVTIYFSNKIYEKILEKDLSYITALINYNINNSNDQNNALHTISSIDKDVRISYFSSDGTPLFDSVADVASMQNHKDRKEIQGATFYGKYASRRLSPTLSKDTYYIAIKLQNGNILRASLQVDTLLKTAIKIIPIAILLFTIIIAISLFLSGYATKKILTPLDTYNGDFEKIDINKIPEISPFVSKISSQKNTIKKHILSINKEKETINTILENMKEGMIVLDDKNKILSMNKKAIEFLDSAHDIIGKNILYATRDEQIIKALNKCYSGEHSSGYIGDEIIIKYYVNPVYENEKITGAIILLIDETKRKSLENIREEFSANVSHELKTPLTSIFGFCELLKNDIIKGENEKREILETMFDEIKHIISLVDDIIMISRLESGNTMDVTDIDINSVAKDVAKSIENSRLQRNISLSINGNAHIKASSVMMWELIYNLMDNAIKYNKDNGSINIEISDEKENAKIQISDTGIGIKEQDIDRIFERFYRADKSRYKKTGGTGLGLSIVKHIVKSHDGQITVSSTPDIGTTFNILLPKNKN